MLVLVYSGWKLQEQVFSRRGAININRYYTLELLHCINLDIIKKWRNLCPLRFSGIRNFHFLVFLSIKLNAVMCNNNKILCTASGDVV